MMKVNLIRRFFKHVVSHRWQVKRHFSDIAFQAIENAIARSEKRHSGEICFVVEAGLHPYEIVYKKTPKKRAIELFGRLRVWDTEHNNGVLIYLLLADRDVEIVADRGIDRHVGHDGWELICHEMELLFRKGEFELGVMLGIEKIGAVLEKHFSVAETKSTKNKRAKSKRNEISNKPIIL